MSSVSQNGKRNLPGVIAALKSCASAGDLSRARRVHAQAVDRGEVSNVFVASTLVSMYAKCGSMVDAHRVFDRMPCHNAIAFTSLMLGYADAGNGELGLEIFSRMEASGCPPDARTFVAATKACSRVALKEEFTQVEGKFLKVVSLEKGVILHDQAAKLGFVSDVFLASSLIDMYANCGSMIHARKVFDVLDSHADITLWNGLMLGYAKNGEGELAMDLFELMETRGCAPNARTVMAGCKACTDLAVKEEGKMVPGGKLVSLNSLEKGMALHSEAAKRGFVSDVFVASTIIDMYAKCGSMRDSRLAFDRMLNHNAVAWNALILGYAENGDPDLSLELFGHMQSRGCFPNALSFVSLLKACSCMAAIEEGRQVGGMLVKVEALGKGMQVHTEAAICGQNIEMLVSNTLLDMYAKCGGVLDARRVFDTMAFHSVVSWNALLQGYVENGEADLALEMFGLMSGEGCQPNSSTLVAAFKACGILAVCEEERQINGEAVKLQALQKGMALHSHAAKNGCISEAFVGTTLIDMYAKCGSLLDSRQVFDKMLQHSIVSWNALMMAYADNAEGDLALELLKHLQKSKVCAPNSLTFVGALKACISLAAKEQSIDIDGKLVKLESLDKAMALYCQAVGYGIDTGILFANTLLDTFSKCGSLNDARKVFDRMPQHSVVSWTALVKGYVDCGEPKFALEMFGCMESQGFRPNTQSFVAALKACSLLATKEEARLIEREMLKARSMEKGTALHTQAFESGYSSDVFVANALVEMYLKCGSLPQARRVFDGMASQDSVVWNALILGYIEKGEPHRALDCFETNVGCIPSRRTFCAALKACSSLAAEEKGTLVDGRLVKVESLKAGVKIHCRASELEHDTDVYVASALVNFYAKCGSMPDAWRVFERMPYRDTVSWTVMILGLADSGEGQIALEFFERLRTRVEILDAPTLLAGLKACSSIGALEPLRRIHGDISRCGLETYPGIANSLINGYGKAGNAVNAQQVFESSLAKPDSVAWTSLIAAQGDTGLVLEFFHQMQEEGSQPDGITFLCVLTACSHGGLVDKAKFYFEKMVAAFGIRPGVEHYHCIVDVLGRANELENAVAMVTSMPFDGSVVSWRTVLAACKKWKNATVGKLMFDQLIKLYPTDEASYLLMEAIYSSNGMREEQAQIEETRRKNTRKIKT